MRHFTRLLILACAAVAYSCQSTEKTSQADEKWVKAEQISTGNARETLKINGEVKERKSVTLSFRVAGPLAELSAEKGDFVKKGQTIARIDPRDYQIQVKQTKAQYEQAKGEYERYKQLYAKGKLPENTYQKIKSGFEIAEAAYQHSQNQLRDTRLLAPFSGYVSARSVNNHETVGAGMPVVAIIDVSAMEIVAKVPSTKISVIENGAKAKADIASLGLKGVALDMVSIGQKTEMDDLYEVKFSFESQPDSKLKTGMLANVKIELPATQGGFVTLPIESIYREAGKDYIWSIRNGKLAKTPVALGSLKNGGRVSLDGRSLRNGEWVVTAGVNSLREGQQVKVLKKESKTNIGGLL
ncbi:RND transporter (plasmid) [Fulvitalea axinellae]|uniref:RND transporter n=1 Tax=Fulvitalea axinellae TaxID=1182444 RepID=A0AAU9CTY1_9BACT|nr:RND transporter [Fulvitalea axinellae]